MVIQHQKKQKTKQKLKKIKLDISEIAKRKNKSGEQKGAMKNIMALYESQEAVSNCLMIILKLYLILNAKQNMEKDSKY